METMFTYLDIQGRIDFQTKNLIILRLNFQMVGDSVDQLPCFEGILEMIVLISRGVWSSEKEDMLISRGGHFQRYAAQMVQMKHLSGFHENI